MIEVSRYMRKMINEVMSERTDKINYYFFGSRSRQRSGLRRALSSLVRKPGPWVRIPLRAWMFSVCVCMCVFLCLYTARGLAMSWSPVQGVLPTVPDQETEETQPYPPKREQAPKCGSNEEEKKFLWYEAREDKLIANNVSWTEHIRLSKYMAATPTDRF
jgi:hypothetical protein